MIVAGLSFEVFEDASSPASPQESASFDGSRSSRSFWFPDGSPLARHQFKRAFLGFSVTKTEGTQRWLSRTIPIGDAGTMVTDADFNPFTLPYLWCKSVPSGSPLGKPEAVDASAAVTYSAYRFNCEFRTVPYRVRPDDGVELIAAAGPLVPTGETFMPDEGDALRRGHPNTRYIQRRVEQATKLNQLKMSALVYTLTDDTPGPWPVGQHFALPVYTETISYTWFEVPEDAIPEKAIKACANGVNVDTFDGKPPGTLLLRAASRRPYNRPIGPGLLYDIEYKMEYLPNREFRLVGGVHRELGWNSIPAVLKPPDGNGLDFYQVCDRETGRFVHPKVDLASLFRPDQP